MKHKRLLLIAIAIVFLLALFYLKNKPVAQNMENVATGLNYSGDETLEELVIKDTDSDVVSDWEESLWGTDINKKDSDNDGKSDANEIAVMKADPANNDVAIQVEPENLTQTDKFARELFSTVASLNQAGAIDSTTVDALSGSLAEQLKNPVQRKVFKITDLKITKDESTFTIQKYGNSLNNIYLKYPIKKGVIDIVQELINDEENMQILQQLDPIINQANKIINESIKIEVPQSLSVLHLNLINASEKLVENISDMKLMENDAIVALSAMSQYENNVDALQLADSRLIEAVKQKLNN